eukprot:6211040-Pleurochrysis_carterae.AAC.1
MAASSGFAHKCCVRACVRLCVPSLSLSLSRPHAELRPMIPRHSPRRAARLRPAQPIDLHASHVEERVFEPASAIVPTTVCVCCHAAALLQYHTTLSHLIHFGKSSRITRALQRTRITSHARLRARLHQGGGVQLHRLQGVRHGGRGEGGG